MRPHGPPVETTRSEPLHEGTGAIVRNGSSTHAPSWHESRAGSTRGTLGNPGGFGCLWQPARGVGALLRQRSHHGATRHGAHGGGQAQRQHTGNRSGEGTRFRTPGRGSPLILEPHAPNGCATVHNGHGEQRFTAKRKQVDAMEFG